MEHPQESRLRASARSTAPHCSYLLHPWPVLTRSLDRPGSRQAVPSASTPPQSVVRRVNIAAKSVWRVCGFHGASLPLRHKAQGPAATVADPWCLAKDNRAATDRAAAARRKTTQSLLHLNLQTACATGLRGGRAFYPRSRKSWKPSRTRILAKPMAGYVFAENSSSGGIARVRESPTGEERSHRSRK